jgi:hypothetical protein
MEENPLATALLQLAGSTNRSKTARLRDIYEQIETAKARGVTHAQIIKTLTELGLEIDLGTFAITLYRLRKEHEKKAKQKHIPHRSAQKPTAKNLGMSNDPAVAQSPDAKPSTPSVGEGKGFFEVLEDLEKKSGSEDPRRS